MATPEWTALDAKLLQEIAEENAGDYPTVTTPFREWNDACLELSGGQGLGPGYYVVLGGATGKGKSTLAVNLAAHAIRHGHSVGFINFEMSRANVAGRFLTIMSGVKARHLQPGRAFRQDLMLEAVRAASRSAKSEAQLYVNTEPIHDLADLTYGVKQLHGFGCDLLIVDYLQLVRVAGQGDMVKRTEATSDKLRGLILDLKTRCIAVSQLTTESGKKQSSKANPPTEYDLYGGGKWAQDSSQVLLIDHTSRRLLANGEIEFKVLIRKNRHGPTGHFHVRFDTNTLRMVPAHGTGFGTDNSSDEDPFSYG
jgi:replicative DNA helicase